MSAKSQIIAIGSSVAAVLVVGAILFAVLSGRDGEPTDEWPVIVDGPLPAQAAEVVDEVVSGDVARVRAVLSPTLAELLPDDAVVASARTTLDLDTNSWQQDGAYASATGVMTVPGQAAHNVVVGFLRVEDEWRVTFMDVAA